MVPCSPITVSTHPLPHTMIYIHCIMTWICAWQRPGGPRTPVFLTPCTLDYIDKTCTAYSIHYSIVSSGIDNRSHTVGSTFLTVSLVGPGVAVRRRCVYYWWQVFRTPPETSRPLIRLGAIWAKTRPKTVSNRDGKRSHETKSWKHFDLSTTISTRTPNPLFLQKWCFFRR